MRFSSEKSERVNINNNNNQKKKKKKWKDRQILGSHQRDDKIVEHADDGNTSYSSRTWNGPQMLGEIYGGIGSQKKNRSYTDYHIVNIG